MLNKFYRKDRDTNGTLFRDILFGLLGAILLILIILLILPKQPKQDESEDSRSRGNIRVEVIWDDKANVDIDTWVKAPGLPPVGYSNMNGPIFNLVRDDLGTYADVTGINYETVFSRGLPPGEYIINVHWFGNAAKLIEIPVKVFVTIRKDDSENSKTKPQSIIRTTVTLKHPGHELTVIRFRLDENGDVDRDSVNSIQKPIRPTISRGVP